MGENTRYTIVRFAVIFIVILLGFVAVIGKIIVLQTTEKDRWLSIAQKQVKTNQPIAATRGNIMDAEGRLLCSSLPQYTVYMDAAVEALYVKNDSLFNEQIDRLSADLSRVIGDEDAAHYKKKITEAHRTHKRSLRVSRKRINYIQRLELEQNPLIRQGKNKSGITFKEVKRRIKLFGNLASRTLGTIHAETGHGRTGLEAAFDKELSGHDGVSTRQKVGRAYQNVTVIDAEDGWDIYTTIDANLQDIAETELQQMLEHTRADWGCCVLMETQTGQIKAIANLDRQPDGGYAEQLNHAVTLVEPGSTFKTIALMALLEDGKQSLTDTIAVTRKAWNYHGAQHRDSHPRDTVYTVRNALAVSSNIALAKMVTAGYDGSAEKFVKKVKSLGIADSTRCEIPGAQYSLIRVPNDRVTISKMAYGYSVLVTPLQLLMFYNAIANNGKMVRPQLVTDIKDDGQVIKHYNTEVVRSQICSKKTLQDIRACLHDVVWDDALGTASVRTWKGHITAYKAQSKLVSIAGKTGTAQLLINGKYSPNDHRMTFVGYFPEDHPQYSCICMINHPMNKGAYDAGMDCGTVVKHIAEKTIAYVDCYVHEDDTLKLIER